MNLQFKGILCYRLGQAIKFIAAFTHLSDQFAMYSRLIFALVGILVCGSATEIRPVNLPLCEQSRKKVSKLLTDVYVVKPQQYDSCYLSNTNTPVVS